MTGTQSLERGKFAADSDGNIGWDTEGVAEDTTADAPSDTRTDLEYQKFNTSGKVRIVGG